MKFTVEVSPIVIAALQRQARVIAADKPAAAERWLRQIQRSIASLESLPRRHGLAESLSHLLGMEIRKLIVGNYVLYFRVDEVRSLIRIVRFRHGAQKSN